MSIARDPRHDVLFEPLQIGPKTLRNRFYQVPHCTGFGNTKPLSSARLRGLKAEGGWAAVCTEWASIGPDSDEHPSNSVNLWDADDARNLALICTEVHRHGSLAGIELVHTGVYARQGESRSRRVAPSQFASYYRGRTFVPMAMEHADIRRVQEDWAQAAVRARDAGFDIVYVFAGDNYLAAQFLSTFYNNRTDEYGGSLENRARFLLETLGLVREAVGSDCAIAVRISLNEVDPAGVSLEEGLGLIRLADHLVDLWDVKVGGSADSGSSRFFAENHQFVVTGRVRGATLKPIVGVGRLTSPDVMADIVSSGAWDLIGGARPSIADPFLPLKIEEGRYDEIRECIGINHCVASFYTRHLGCAQNATVGEEYRRGWHPERFERARNGDRDALVVGAGPAGMECAIVLGKRGFRRVHLVEAEPDVGGSLRWIPLLPGLGEWARLVNWRRIQLAKLTNVEVITGMRLDARAVREYGAEIVVVATGAFWARDGLSPASHATIPGADSTLPHVLTPEQIMVEGKRPPGERVVVYDCEGDFTGAGLAEKLAVEGCQVEFVTPLRDITPREVFGSEGALVRKRLHEVGVAAHLGFTVTSIDPGLLQVVNEFHEPLTLDADGVVLVTQRRSNDALYLELAADQNALAAEGIEAIYRVGDCAAPGKIADAIFEGHRLAREIDSPDPAVPLPHLRERMVVQGTSDR